MRLQPMAIVVLLALGGCLDSNPAQPTPATSPGSSSTAPTSSIGPCDDVPFDSQGRAATDARLQTRYAGTGKWNTSIAPATLRPGSYTVFQGEFWNPDCRTFTFSVDYADGVLAFGREPLEFATIGKAFRLTNWGYRSDAFPAAVAVRAYTEFSVATRWDGSTMLWEHASVERGEPWQQRRYYVAPGTWPVEWRFPYSSYPVVARSNVTVEATPLNAQSPLRLDACRHTDTWGWANLTDVRITPTPRTVKIGTPISVAVEYTIQLPGPGCYLMEGKPDVYAARSLTMYEGAFDSYPLDGDCSSDGPEDILIEATSSAVKGRLSFTYNGLDGTSNGCRPRGEPGNETLEFRGHGFGYFEPTGARVNITWLPP